MDTKELYKDAAGVDIDNVYQEYGTSRAIGYDGEYALFDYLLRADSRFDNSKVLTNLEIPVLAQGKTTEIDMIMICEYGIIVFEVKNYKGTIYGTHDEQYWTQYFRTADNQRFINPIKQNEYHISALKEFCSEKLFSVILFPNYDCDIRRVAFRDGNFTVANMRSLDMEMERISSMPKTISQKRIEEISDELKKYSKAKNSADLYGTTNYHSLEELRNELRKSVDVRVEEATGKAKNEYKKKASQIRIRTTIVCIVCVILTFIFARDFSNKEFELTKERDEALEKYEEMSANFSVASEEDMAIARSILTVSELTLTPHDYYLDSYYLKFSITNNTSNLLIYFNDTKNGPANLFVTLKDGTVAEVETEYGSTRYGIVCNFTYDFPYSFDEIQSIVLKPITLKEGSKEIRVVSLTLYEASDEGE